MRACAAASFSVGTPEIRRFCQTVRRISPSPNSRAISASPRICATVIRPTGTTTPIQFSPSCFCAMHADMGGAIEVGPRRDRAGHGAVELAAELLLHGGEKFLDAHGVEHIFQPRLGAVGAVAVLDEDAHDRVGDHAGIFRAAHDAGIAGEVAMAR